MTQIHPSHLSTPKEQPRCFMLIGLPGCGKTTWRNHMKTVWPIFHPNEKLWFISSDDHIEQLAKARGETYDQAFRNVADEAATKMHDNLHEVTANTESFVWDQTNLSAKSRQSKFRLVPPGYMKIGVFFNVDPAICLQRQAQRPGKAIPSHVMHNMILQWQGNFPLSNLNKEFDKVIITTD